MLSANGQVLCGWEVQLSCKQALLSTLRALSVLPTLFCPETHDGVGGLRYPPDICGEESAESRPVSVSLGQPLGWILEDRKAPELLRARR